MKVLRWVGLAVFGVLLIGGSASAQTLGPVVVDSGVNGSNANAGNFSDFSQGDQAGNSFTLNQSTKLAGVRWWGMYYRDPTADNFSVRIFETTGGVPTNTPLYDFALGNSASRTADGNIDDLSQYKYEASLPSTTLGPGTYVLSIVNNTSFSDGWYWSTQIPGAATDWARFSDGGSWTNDGNANYAFQLTGVADDTSAVPEPGAVALFLPALGAVLVVRRRVTR